MKRALAALAAVALLALAGCTDKADTSNVDRRAVERWNYLIAHQAEKAWDYLTPGYRSTRTKDSWAQAMNTRPVQWKEAKFKDKECDAERCKVRVDVTYSVLMPGTAGKATAASSTVNEIWLLVDGDWYFLPK